MLLSETAGSCRGSSLKLHHWGTSRSLGGPGTLSPGRQCGGGAQVKNDWDFN